MGTRFTLGLMVLSVTAMGVSAGDAPREPKRRTKGVELYSWKAKGKWQYALISGTNRLKPETLIKAPKYRLKGLKELKKALARLAVSENVFWFHPVKGFEFPDAVTRKDLSRYAGKVRIKLHMPRQP